VNEHLGSVTSHTVYRLGVGACAGGRTLNTRRLPEWAPLDNDAAVLMDSKEKQEQATF